MDLFLSLSSFFLFPPLLLPTSTLFLFLFFFSFLSLPSSITSIDDPGPLLRIEWLNRFKKTSVYPSYYQLPLDFPLLWDARDVPHPIILLMRYPSSPLPSSSSCYSRPWSCSMIRNSFDNNRHSSVRHLNSSLSTQIRAARRSVLEALRYSSNCDFGSSL